MKQVLTSAGVLAFGAASLYALDPEMTRQSTGSPFSLAGTVRGFYDDNVYTAPKDKEESFGFQVIPSVHLNLPLEQTFISLGYLYTLSWYDNRSDNDTDQAHEFNAKIRHQFSPRHKISVDDTFVYTSEPTVADQTQGIVTTPLRTTGSVYHNLGTIDHTFGLTKTLDLSLGYVNSWYDYTEDGDGSRSALLDRFEHLIRGDIRYNFNPKLVGIVGYSFGFTTYTGDELIDVGSTLKSDDRNSKSHYGYFGVDYDITAKLRTTVRLGWQYTEYDDLNQSSSNPYANLAVAYKILNGTSVEAGLLHARNATDIAAIDNNGDPTTDAQTTSLYTRLSHQITRELTGSVMGQYQYSVFYDGLNDDKSEALWLLGVNLNYAFNRHWSAEIGYNYDQLVSHVKVEDRSYDRNRVYIGVTARY